MATHSIVDYTTKLKSYFTNAEKVNELAADYVDKNKLDPKKNILPSPYLIKAGSSYGYNGLLFTPQDNGAVLVDGTAAGYDHIPLTFMSRANHLNYVLEAGDYIMSLDAVNPASVVGKIVFLVRILDITTTPTTNTDVSLYYTGAKNEKAFTVSNELAEKMTSGQAYVDIRLSGVSGTGADNVMLLPMIRKVSHTNSEWQATGIKTNEELTLETKALSSDSEEKIAIPCFSMFDTFGVVGDSYSSGYIVTNPSPQQTVTCRNIAWGQVLARLSGNTCTLFARPGATSKSWLTDSEFGKGLLDNTEPLKLYIVCLGINDYYTKQFNLGTAADIGTAADSFYGYYSRVIDSITTHAPNAAIILSTMRDGRQASDVLFTPDQANEAIREIAAHYELPCIRPSEDALFNSTYYLDKMVGGHPVAQVYSAMASAYKRLIEKSMKDNFNYFKTYTDTSLVKSDVELSTLKTTIAASNDFADFQSRIAAL